MSTDHVVSGLARKYAELAGKLRKCETEAATLSISLEHLREAIRLFQPDYRIRSIKPKRPIQKSQIFRKGEITRDALAILRGASEPMDVREIGLRILARRNIDDVAALETVTTTLRPSFRNMRKRRVLKDDGGSPLRWSIV